MGKSSATIFGVFLVILLAIQAMLLLGKGVLLINQHEGDALHLIQIVLRMVEGQRPHLDFSTPIGVMAFAPVAWLVALGAGIGQAIAGSFVLVTAMLLPMLWWASTSRLTTGLSYAFGIGVILLGTAMVHGGGSQYLSISMYYNRFAWAVSFILVVVILLPAKHRHSQILDGLVIGLGLSFLAMSKITFFVAFLPAIILALLLRKQWGAILAAVLIGALTVVAITLWAGTEFWLAYIGDLQSVRTSGIRAEPSGSLISLLIGQRYIVANLCLLAAIVLLRQTASSVEGLVMLLLAPAFIYVTYQNWGNDPQWLFLLAIVLLALRPDKPIRNAFGWDVRQTLGVTALVSIALILPSSFTVAFSALKHARQSTTAFAPMFPSGVHTDILARKDRMYALEELNFPSYPDEIFAANAPSGMRGEPDALFGQPLAICKQSLGHVGLLQYMARDIDANVDVTGQTIFVADTFSNLWLFGKSMPLAGGAPWYYGGDAGLLKADFLLVPLCPVTATARTAILKELASNNSLNFSEVRRTGVYILLARN